MKKIIATIIALSSLTAFAQVSTKAQPASKKDKQILCKSVDKQLEADAADAAVDLTKCLKTKMTSRLVSEGIIEVTGKVPFNSPSRNFTSKCSVSYDVLNDELIAEAACE